MSTQIDVQGLGKWELIYSDTKTSPDGRDRYRRRQGPLIEPFDVPVIFDGHVLAMGASYLPAPATWFNCANVLQLAIGATIDDPGVWADGFDGTEPIIISRKQLRLNQSLELFQFQKVSAELRIGISPMPWIPEFSYGIYQFKGVVSDTTEDLITAAQAQLATVEFKVDLLRVAVQGQSGEIDGNGGDGDGTITVDGNP